MCGVSLTDVFGDGSGDVRGNNYHCGGGHVKGCVAVCVTHTIRQHAVTKYNAMITIANPHHISQPYPQLHMTTEIASTSA